MFIVPDCARCIVEFTTICIALDVIIISILAVHYKLRNAYYILQCFRVTSTDAYKCSI